MPLKSFLFVLFFLSFSNVSRAQDYAYPDIKKSVFQIQNNIDESAGTAFYIGNNQFVTNVHSLFSLGDMTYLSYLYNVLSKKNNLTEKKQEIIKALHEDNNDYQNLDISDILSIKYKNHHLFFNKIVAIDFKNDLIILELQEKDLKLLEELIPLKVGPFSKKIINKKGHVYGFPADKPHPFGLYTFKEMIFNNIFFYDLNTFSVLTNVNHVQGASGSPVLIDGKVLGIVYSSSGNSVGVTSSNALIELLNKKAISLTKEKDIIDSFLSFLQKLKMNPKKDGKSLTFLYDIESQAEVFSYKRILELEELLKNNPNPSPIVYTYLAFYYSQIKDYKKSIEMGNKSGVPHVLYYMGIIQLEIGHADEAVLSLKKSAEQEFSSALFALAIYYFVKNDTELYQEYIKKAADKGHFLAQIRSTQDGLQAYFPADQKEFIDNPDLLPIILRNNPSYMPIDHYIELFTRSLIPIKESLLPKR